MDRPPPAWVGRAFGLLFAALLLLLAEGLSRALVPISRLESIQAVLEQDPILFWRQRPGLDTAFQGVPVRTDRHGFRLPDTAPDVTWGEAFPRVLCLGASPDFGWGVRADEAYAAVLEVRLREMGWPRARVRNGGQIGWSSFQGRTLLEGADGALGADVVTLGYVINDVDRYRFYRSNGLSDAQVTPLPVAEVRLRNLLDRSRAFRLGERMQVGLGTPLVNGAPLAAHVPGELRVSAREYRANLEAMVTRLRDLRALPVFVEMPVHLPPGEVPRPEVAARVADLMDRARPLVANGDCAAADPILEEALGLWPDLSEAWVARGSCAARAGRATEAEAFVQQGMMAESHRCGRDGLRYNATMAQTAIDLGVSVLDVPPIFENAGGDLFVPGDPIHPNARGHALIGEGLAGVLEPLLPASPPAERAEAPEE